jgi:voltage-gated potassium channel
MISGPSWTPKVKSTHSADTGARLRRVTDRQRERALERLQRALEVPMIVLAFVWLLLMVIEFTRGLSPVLEVAIFAIWMLFLLHFGTEFVLAPHKLRYLSHNWLTAVALAAPALRLLRVLHLIRLLRVARVARGLRLFRVVSSLNRGLRVLSQSMSRRGFGYVVALTLLVTVGGAAGMYTLERDLEGGPGFDSFGTALWWTAMLMTTMGSGYWPESAEARVLCMLLALYAFAVFGYVTAALASFFVGRDAQHRDGEIAGAAQLDALRREIAALRQDFQGRG